METFHKPVLLSRVLECLKPQPYESYLDLTAGYGGHARAILDVTRNYKDASLVDRDEFAISELTKTFGEKGVKIIHSDFYSAALQHIECGNSFDMILADLGVSSVQVDRAERGFSFAKNGPLDMRMDRTQELSAEIVVNKYSLNELAEIFEKYGEVRPGLARNVAKEIVTNRPIFSTGELADLVAKFGRGGRRHPATQFFQAIRIVVNDELGLLEKTLPLIPQLLKVGGRFGIITFHSLEDRIVKDFIREACSHGEESVIAEINRKPIGPEVNEVVINPRARSAKLRCGVRIR